MLIVAALLTAFYMFRLLFSTFAGEYRGSHEPHVENVLTMNVPVVVLAGLATIGGFFASPLAAFLGGSFVRYSALLQPLPDRSPNINELNWPVAAGMFLLAVAGIAAAYALYVVRPSLRDGFKRALAGPRELLLNAYYLDTVYHVLFEVPAYALAGFCAKYFDPAVIDGIPRALAGATGVLGDAARGWESGQLRRYGLTIAIGVVLLLAYYAFVMHAGQAPEATMAR
jgi:NADH-quinone oxidoreductase subunit L